MKWILLACFLLCLLSCCTGNMTMAEVTELSEPMDDKRVTEIQFLVGRGYTIVEEQSRTLFINYDDGVLFNLSKETNLCRRFNISSSSYKDDFVAGEINIFSELIFLKEGQQQTFKGQDYPQYTVINAPHAMLLRGVTTTRFEQFGVTFTPGVTAYAIMPDHATFRELVALAEHNSAIAGEINPLIFQLDITHLLKRIGGVPVCRIKKDKVTELFFAIEKENTLRALFPSQCVGL